MKNLISALTPLIFAAGILPAGTVWAQATEHRDGPCMKIMDACKNAGFGRARNGEKKSLSKDCMQPLLNGQSVAGVSVSAADIAACKAKKSELKKNK